MDQFHFHPEGYLELMLAEMPGYFRLQDAAAVATGTDARRILELGTGTGETARRVLARHPGATFVGIDASRDMLGQAQLPGADLRVARLEDPLPDGPFDLVFSVLAIHHLDGPGKANLFRRVAAALAPGGRFVLGDVVVPDDPADALTPLNPGFDLPSPVADQLQWLRAAGLHPAVTWQERDLAVIACDMLPRGMVIAIDGPAGAGKSSVARAVADALGFAYLDTGAMYRCVGLAATESGDPAAEVAKRIAIEVGDRVLIDGRDVTDAIRTPEVSEAASRAAADPAVRAALVAKQQALIAEGDWVAEGRDIGLVVAPDAAVKVYLTASPEERARRRAAELGIAPDEVHRAQRVRDERDATGPRGPAPDAVPVDTTGLTLDEVVAQIVMLAVEAREIGA